MMELKLTEDQVKEFLDRQEEIARALMGPGPDPIAPAIVLGFINLCADDLTLRRRVEELEGKLSIRLEAYKGDTSARELEQDVETVRAILKDVQNSEVSRVLRGSVSDDYVHNICLVEQLCRDNLKLRGYNEALWKYAEAIEFIENYDRVNHIRELEAEVERLSKHRWQEETCGTCKSYLGCYREGRLQGIGCENTPACDEWHEKEEKADGDSE